ncbi:putative ferric-chelate reductase (NADH) [Dioscorea sansibarensis]
MAPKALLVSILKFSMAVILAAWVCLWFLKPTQVWKSSWHDAEDWATNTFLGASGLNVVVFCFPLLAVAAMVYVHIHMDARKGRVRYGFIELLSRLGKFNPLIVRSPVGVIAIGELIFVALFILLLAWTYYSNVSSDFKSMTSSKSMKLSRWQLKVMRLGVRFGSLSEACLAVLLLPVLRGMALFRVFGIQFEASVRYHIWIGNTLIMFSVLHGLFIMFSLAAKNSLLEELTKWQRTGRVYPAGAITLVVGLVIWMTSLPQIRRKKFLIFYSFHHLYVVFLLFFLLHAGDRHFYLVFSGVLLFVLDKILRFIQSSQAVDIISANILACKAVELTLRKHPRLKYTPTSIIFLKIPCISKVEWHPFSITSSANIADDKLSVLIKCQGHWTDSVHNLIQAMLDNDHEKKLSVTVEGPYGPATFPYQRYDSLILIAGGSGITPFLSILQDIVAQRIGSKNTCAVRIQLIYAVKRSEDLSMLAPISLLLLNNESDGFRQLGLKIFVTQEEKYSATAREILHEMCQVKTVILDVKSSKEDVIRPESLLWKATVTVISSLTFLASIVVLNRIFGHQGKKASKDKAPSWVNDLLVLCSLMITAASVTIMATFLLKLRNSVKDMCSDSQNNVRTSEIQDVEIRNCQEDIEIYFGKRPNLIDVLSELPRETGDAEVGVIVCGPESMRQSVASFCKTKGKKKRSKHENLFNFHSINFSL